MPKNFSKYFHITLAKWISRVILTNGDGYLLYPHVQKY